MVKQVGLVVSGGLMVAAVVARSPAVGRQSNGGIRERVGYMETRTAGLETRVAGLEDAPTAIARATSDVAQRAIEPTAPARASVDDSESAAVDYVDAVLAQTNSIPSELDRLSDLVESPRFGDASWESDLREIASSIEGRYAAVAAMTPPPSLQEGHDLSVEGLRLISSGVRNGVEGAIAFDMGLVEQGADELGRGSDKLEEAADFYRAFAPSGSAL